MSGVSISIKISLDDDTRRRAWHAPFTFASLKALVCETYHLADNASMRILQRDEQDDHITLKTDDDVVVAVDGARQFTNNVLRLCVKDVEQGALNAEQFVNIEQAEAVVNNNNNNNNNNNDADADGDGDEQDQDQDENPFGVVVDFFQDLAQSVNNAAADEPHPVVEFFEQLHAKMSTVHSKVKDAAEASGAHVHRQLRRAVDQLAERGVLARDSLERVYAHLVAAPAELQTLVLRLMAQANAHAQSLAPPTHHAAICDACRTPIVGVRYKCANCADFDLCALCESANDGAAHTLEHVFLKLHQPLRPRAAFSLPTLYAPPPPPPLHQPLPPPPRLVARFEEHVTVPEASHVSRGDEFVKIWAFRNTGRTAWPAGCRLVAVGGDVLGASSALLPAVAPNDTLNVSVDMRVESDRHEQTQFFRLETKEGVRFGERVWCSVVVDDEADEADADDVVEEEKVNVEDSFQLIALEEPKVEQDDDGDAAEDSSDWESEEDEPRAEEQAEDAQEQQQPDSDEFVYEAERKQLIQMGFLSSAEENERGQALLVAHEGNVLAVVQQLLDDADQ
eukprot:TRINITY_DN146_c0_g1_i1.p1 TRINITY_DN146_c0_g1~~TRINITY_DN146_c0_g1_i1.p1  ORF type:complete len:565 (-),score=318.25 TRINITY_DN146_c0_g1_i1:21-1715(-)